MHRIVAATLVLTAAAAHGEPIANLGAAKLPALQHAPRPRDPDRGAKTFADKRGRFWIVMPGAPTESTFELAGKQTAHRFELVKAADEFYIVQYVELGRVDANAALDAATASAIATSRGKLVGAIGKPKLDDGPARDATVELDNGATIALRFVYANGILYEIAAGDATATSAVGFVSSFSLREPVRSVGVIEAPKQPARAVVAIVDALVVEGPLDRDAVHAAIKRASRALVACYEQRVANEFVGDPKVRVRFAITTEGRADGARGIGSDRPLARCVADVVAAIAFPKPNGARVDVTCSIRFDVK